MASTTAESAVGQGVYGATEGLRLLNFHRESNRRGSVSRNTMARWLRGYNFTVRGKDRHSCPLWTPDYPGGDSEPIELSFRDLIELRFVKAFRDAGLGLAAIRECFARAVEEVRDERPFSTRKFRTDGKTIFLDITRDLSEGELVDLRGRQIAFRTIIEPSFRDLEFDADAVARWHPLGDERRTILIDPARAFGRPIVADGGVPTEIIAAAVGAEGSTERVARLYEVPHRAVRDALVFEQKLAA
jgi:uncharacterized protein (DUF433 family)